MEEWDRLSLPLEEEGGVKGLIEKRSGYSINWNESDSANDDSLSSVLQHYPIEGNPFAIRKRYQWLENKALLKYSFKSIDADEQQIKRMLNNNKHELFPQFDQDDLVKFGSKHVISSSSLSGFLRYQIQRFF
jgi:hypothetical protein